MSPLTEKCGYAVKVATAAGEAATRALLAAEYALDMVNAAEKRHAAALRELERAREQLTKATKLLLSHQADLNRMALAFVDRQQPAATAAEAVPA